MFSLKALSATAQLDVLKSIFHYSKMDFHGEVAANRAVVFAHFPFWSALATSELDLTTLAAIQAIWAAY